MALDPKVAEDLGNLAYELGHDPKTRKAFGKLVREAKPDSLHARAFSDVDIEDKFEAFKKEQADKELKAQQDAYLTQMNQQRQNLLTGGLDGNGPKYNEEQVKQIEKYMQDHGLTNYDHGRILWANENPPLAPPDNDPPPNMHGDKWTIPDFEKFKDDPDGAARNVAYGVIKELRQKRRA
jgi:hypothetical protein